MWGPVEGATTDEKSVLEYRGLLNDTALTGANAEERPAIFQRTCAACHKLYGEGGTLGPDLTGSNRANLNWLLFNVLEPNAEVQDAYKMVVVTTRDGRTYSGNVVSENDRQVTLRVVGREAPVAITKSDIQSREATAVSMMPPGLLDTLADSEVIDLVGYLRTTAPVKYRVLRCHALPRRSGGDDDTTARRTTKPRSPTLLLRRSRSAATGYAR